MGAIFVAQAIATLISVYGIFIQPIGWGWALLVWGYALVWFVINDQFKLLAYKFLNGNVAASLLKKMRKLG